MKFRIAVIALAVALLAPVGASGQGVCGMARDTLIKETLKAYGVPDGAIEGGEAGYEAWGTYLSSRSDEALNKAAQSVTQSILKATVPEAGIVISGTGAAVTATQMLIEEEESLRIKAFTCGNFSFGAPQGISFFAMREVQAMSPGIDCDNFEQRLTTRAQYERLQSIWQGRFTRETRTYRGSDAETDQMLGQGWAQLRDRWMTLYAKKMYDDIKRKMALEVVKIAKDECTAAGELVRQGEAPAGWAGTYEGHRFYYYVSGSSTVLTIRYTSSDPNLDQHGSIQCGLINLTQATCRGGGDYRDEDKSIAYTESWEATLSGDTISGTNKVLTSNQNWREGVSRYEPYLSAGREGSFSITRMKGDPPEEAPQPNLYPEVRAPDY
jgi:hypothetical protein